MLTPEMQAKIAEWQAKVADGTITMEELKESVAYLRSIRNTTFNPPKVKEKAPAKPKSAKVPAEEEKIDTEALKNELGNLLGLN